MDIVFNKDTKQVTKKEDALVVESTETMYSSDESEDGISEEYNSPVELKTNQAKVIVQDHVTLQ